MDHKRFERSNSECTSGRIVVSLVNLRPTPNIGARPLLRNQTNRTFRGPSSASMVASCHLPFPAPLLSYHRSSIPLAAFAFLHHFTQFPMNPSRISRVFGMWYSRRVFAFRSLVKSRLRSVPHSNRFAFLHQWKRFQNSASTIAAVFRRCCSNAVLGLGISANRPSVVAAFFNRFAFLRQFKQSQNYLSAIA
jgi:hypothetical protein